VFLLNPAFASKDPVDCPVVLQGLGLHMSEHWASRDFANEYEAKCVRLGLPPF
jgi:hypothetical protein